jgi:hypothetical protein
MTKATWPLAAFIVQDTRGEPRRIAVSGRDRWALESLMRAGPKGCTPIDHPGPRWSAYVFNLKEAGVAIEKVTEPHKGHFPGHHARYRLACTVAPIRAEGGAE